jgi:hypothetical protein
MSTLLAASGSFERQLFKDGERLMILSSCRVCGEARVGSSYDGSLQYWESEHSRATCAPAAASAQVLTGQRFASPNKTKPYKFVELMWRQRFRSAK